VNDVQIIEAANEWRVTGADGQHLRIMETTRARHYAQRQPVEVIDWADVGYLAIDAPPCS